MSANIELTDHVLQAAEGKVIKQRDPKKTFVSLILLVLAGGCILLSTLLEETGTALYTGTFTVGFALAAVGLLMLFFAGKALFFAPTKSKVTLHSLFFDQSDTQALMGAIESKDFDRIGKLKQVDNSGLRLDVLRSADAAFAAAQLYRYIPHNYEPASQACWFCDERAAQLSRLVK